MNKPTIFDYETKETIFIPTGHLCASKPSEIHAHIGISRKDTSIGNLSAYCMVIEVDGNPAEPVTGIFKEITNEPYYKGLLCFLKMYPEEGVSLKFHTNYEDLCLSFNSHIPNIWSKNGYKKVTGDPVKYRKTWKKIEKLCLTTNVEVIQEDENNIIIASAREKAGNAIYNYVKSKLH